MTVSDNLNDANRTLSPMMTDKKILNLNDIQKLQLSYRQSSPQILINEKQTIDRNNNNLSDVKEIRTALTCSSKSSKSSSNFSNTKPNDVRCRDNFIKERRFEFFVK